MSTDHLIPVIPLESAVMTRGEGSFVFDRNGKRYTDLTSGQFCAVLGNSNAEVLRELARRTAGLVHTSTAIISDEVLACAQNLYRISGEMRASSIILSTGAEVIEFCLRNAKSIQGKPGVVCFTNGYHGLTLGAQSVTFGGRYTSPHVTNIYAVTAPDAAWTEDQVATSLEEIDRLFSANNDIAAFLVEPIVSVGGMVFPPVAWFHAVRELCDKHDVLLVLDECQSGFGRTGDWFAYQTYGFVPDMVAAAKAIGLGYPVAAALFRDSLVERVSSLPAHYSSHQNDPFGAAVINTAISYIEANDVLSQVKAKGAHFLAALEHLTASNPHLTRPRGEGLMLGVDLYFDGVTNYRPIYKQLTSMLMERGVILQGTEGGRVLRFLPDFLIDDNDVDQALATLDAVISELHTAA